MSLHERLELKDTRHCQLTIPDRMPWSIAGVTSASSSPLLSLLVLLLLLSTITKAFVMSPSSIVASEPIISTSLQPIASRRRSNGRRSVAHWQLFARGDGR